MVVVGGILIVGLLAVLFPRASSVTPKAAPAVKRLVPTAFIASRALPAGTILNSADIAAKQDSAPVPAGAVSSENDLLGRVLAKSYTAEQTILREDLRDVSTLGITARIAPGERAFSIRVGEDDIVGGFLQTGDHVDVFATIPGSVFPSKNSSDVPDRSRTVLLLQDVLVLAVGENQGTHGSVQSDARTVTLSLSPDALAKLALAQRYGKVSMAVRVWGDTSVSKDISARLSDLVRHEAPVHSPFVRRRKAPGAIPFLSGTHASSLLWAGSR